MTSATSKECQVCREKPATAEGVFMFGRTVDALVAASVRYSGDLEAWPSVWLCDECIETTEPAFAALDELPAGDLVGITTPLLVTICRLAAGRLKPPTSAWQPDANYHDGDCPTCGNEPGQQRCRMRNLRRS